MTKGSVHGVGSEIASGEDPAGGECTYHFPHFGWGRSDLDLGFNHLVLRVCGRRNPEQDGIEVRERSRNRTTKVSRSPPP